MTAVSKSEERAMMTFERAMKALPPGVARASGSIQVGPFFIKYTLTTSEAHVEGGVKVASWKAKLISVTLTPSKPSITASADAKLVKASLTITVNFARMKITAKGKVCVRVPFAGWKCKKYSWTFP